MKHAIVMAALAVALFVVTVVGVLGAQGRLNREGVQGLPLLPMLFGPAPEGDGAEGKTADPKAKDAGNGAHGAKTAKEGPPAGALGKEQPLPYRLGAPLFDKDGKGKDDHAGDHGESKPPAPEPHPAAEAKAEPKADPHADPKAGQRDPEWDRQVDDLMGQGQYQPGRFFEFPRLPAGVTVDAINEILGEARALQKANQDEKAALAQRKAELDARENDVKDRQDELAKRMRDVETMRSELEESIKKAQGTVVLVQASEKLRWRENARSLAKFEPKKAADVLLDWWKTEERQEMALKTLALMEADPRDEILAVLPPGQLREVLERRLRVYVEADKKEGGR